MIIDDDHYEGEHSPGCRDDCVDPACPCPGHADRTVRYIWSITISGDESIYCESHYSSEEQARAALAQLRSNHLTHIRQELERVFNEVEQGIRPDRFAGILINEAWVQKRMAEETERHDNEWSVERHRLDPPTPVLDGST